MAEDEVSSAFNGLARNKEELAKKLAESQHLPSLNFEWEGKRIQILHEDGCRVSLGQIFYRYGNNFVIGEVLYAHARIYEPENFGREPLETVVPLVVLSFYEDGKLVARDLKPYVMARKVMLRNRPVVIEAKTRLAGTLETLMSLEAAVNFVNGSEPPSWLEAYSEVKAAITRFCNLEWDSRLYDVCSCWVLATYFAEIMNALPFLYPYGSTGTGKTRLLKTVVYMSRHGFLVTDPTEAVLFRTSEALKPSLGVDESLIGSMAWKLIRTAFKKGMFVPRVEETKRNEFVVGLFETYMPVAFASTEMPKELGGCDADEARAIFIFMQRMPDPSGRDPDPWDFKELRDKLYLLRLGRANEVVQALEQVEAENLPFSGHEREVWLPLLTIAKLAGEEAFNNVLAYAVEVAGIKALQQNQNEKIVVKAILQLFRAVYADAVKMNPDAHVGNVEFTSSILQEYAKQVLEEWGEYDEHLFSKQWDSRVIGRILTKLGIFKRLKAGRSHYFVSVDKLRQLYKQFYGGLGGFVGLKKEGGKPKNNPPTNPPATLTVFVEGSGGGLPGGLEKGQSTFKINPTNPPNPPLLKSVKPEDVLKLERLTVNVQGECVECRVKGRMDWQVTLHDRSWGLLCAECGFKLLKQLGGES